jgi:membrane protease YdiL (CAAX protease family)
MKRPLLAFTGVAYAWTWVTVLPLLLQKRGVVDLGLPDAYEAVGAFGPFIAAWLVTRRTGGSAAFRAGLTRFALPPAGWGLALLTPVAFLLLAMLVVALQTGSPPSLAALRDGRLGSPGAIIDLIIVGSLLQAVGEEPGWRGCLLPGLLARFGRLRATLILFPAWWLWHLPFFLGRPEFGLPQFLGFGLGILSASVWLTSLWERTRSVPVAIAWHTVLNITRGIALGFSTAMFLAYGLVVTVGAVGIVALWRYGDAKRRRN